jgi:hypothetical protein
MRVFTIDSKWLDSAFFCDEQFMFFCARNGVGILSNEHVIPRGSSILSIYVKVTGYSKALVVLVRKNFLI